MPEKKTAIASRPGQRVIKKYPNRRLYDTDTSTYITLTEVKQLVMDSATFQVIDAKTGDDLTRSILLQIILEEEAGGAPMFTEAVLGNIIRLADDLGMNVICEGVETAEQSAIIMKLGCYTAQGFFYARPEPTHDFEARLAMQGM